VPPVMSAALVSLLVVGAGWGTRLCSGSKTVVVPAEGECCFISGGQSSVLAVVPVTGAGISGTGIGVSGTEGMIPEAGKEAVPLGAECRHLPEGVLDLLLKCSAIGGGAMLVTASGGATS
jgi:hypothetical protein